MTAKMIQERLSKKMHKGILFPVNITNTYVSLFHNFYKAPPPELLEVLSCKLSELKDKKCDTKVFKLFLVYENAIHFFDNPDNVRKTSFSMKVLQGY